MKEYYGIIPADVRYDESLCASAKLMMAEISALSNEKGYCWANNLYFSNLYKVHIVTVSRWISQLATKGFIKIVGNTYNRRIYPVINKNANSNKTINKNVNNPKQKCLEPLTKTLRTINKNVKHNTIVNNISNNKSNTRFNFNKHFEEIYSDYPRKEGKKQALRYFKTSVKNDQDLLKIRKALDNYIRKLKLDRTDPQFIKMASTWFNNWEDWENYQVPNLGKIKVDPSPGELLTKQRKADADRIIKEKVEASAGSTAHKNNLNKLYKKMGIKTTDQQNENHS